jgi:hypothetical protein
MDLAAVQDYIQRGYSLVPFRAIRPEPGQTKWGKRPFVKWESRQRALPDPETVLAEFRKFPDALIGCCTGAVSGICNLDVDTDEGRAQADELLPDSLETPTYKTISGGLQMVFEAPADCPPGATRFLPGLDFRGDGACTILPPHKLGYSWLPGLSLADCHPAPLPSELKLAIINNNNNSNKYKGDDDIHDDTAEKYFSRGRRNEDIFSTSLALVKQKLPEKLIRQAIETIAKNCKPPLPPDEVESVLQSAFQRGNKADRNLAADVRDWVLSTNGNFLSTEIYSCLQLSTRDDRKNVSIALKRLADEGVIERYGNKNGCFRRIETELEPLDWRNADTNPLSLEWPFGLKRLVNLYPGNIVVIAGSPNSGKTAFLLNFIRLNQDKHDVHLFSSEGGKEELRLRLSKFDCPLDSWRFNAWERGSDFADVIRPGAVNVIDYLEVHDDFYKIGGTLKMISDKLKGGLAVIALQKNRGRDEGLGGARGLEKPRLYLSMDSGVTKIVKAKSWADSTLNPNGLSIDWKLVDGCKFLNTGSWRHDP